MNANQSDGTGTISRKFVKSMAKKFEQISTESTCISSHEANFRHCNWWLDIPASATCFDDIGLDPQQIITTPNSAVYDVNMPDTIPFETAEIANEHQTTNAATAVTDLPDGIEQRQSTFYLDKGDFFQQINACLRFPATQRTNEDNEKIR